MRTGTACLAIAIACALTGCGASAPDADLQHYLDLYTAARAPQPHHAPGRSPETDRLPPTRDPEARTLVIFIPRPLLADMDKPVGPEPGGPGEPAAPATRPVKPKDKHWSERRGPAYPGDLLHTIGRDFKELPTVLWDDTYETFTDPTTLALLAAAGAAGGIVAGTGLDDTVEDCFDYDNDDGGSRLNSEWDGIGGFFGSPAVHFPAAGLMYLVAVLRDDVKGYETSKALINALAINGATTLALKNVFRTHSPNGDPFGWPSGHTSSSFCLATVLHEAYGPWVGVPLFAFATFVAYERVDARNHDLSDVVSGALIGIAIGRAVMKNHHPRVFGFDVIPYAHPNGATGLALVKQF